MKNFKTIMLSAFVALFAFSSCSSSNDDLPETGGKDLSVNIKLSHATTRAVGEHVDNDEITFNEGQLLFTNGDIVTKFVTIVTSSPTGDEVALSELENGKKFENVPGSSTHVHFVGNPVTLVTVPTNIKDYTEQAVPVESQYDATDGGVKKVTLYGKGAINAITPGNPTTEYQSIFDVSAIASRIEIGTIKGEGQLKSFKVEGIFVNNYYNTMELAGVVSDKKSNDSDPENYKSTADSGTGSYDSTVDEAIYDYDANGIGFFASNKLVCHPKDPANADNNVWGYNLLAETATPATTEMIGIVIRISDVKLTGDDSSTYSGTHFLSINKFFNTDDSGANTTGIDKLEPGHVYRIKELKFDEKNLTPKPNQKPIKVNVDVTMLDWTSKEIGYDFD